MIIFFLIFALFAANPEGAPIGTSSIPQCHCDAVDIYLRDNPTNSHFGTRARNDIIVSCLATILACTWTTIHPNVPAPGESGWNLLKQKVVTWIYALLAPEAITAWAMRQYFAARWIANEYNSDFADKISMSIDFEYKNQWTYSLIERPLPKRTQTEKIKTYVHEWIYGSPLSEGLEKGEIRPWTITHGFFFQMGGFMMCETGRPVRSYGGYYNFCSDLYHKKINAPTTTESEIQDRSKRDALSKTIVILQTTWFIAQCIARWSAHLPVTELEVVTLGFAMLNALTYGFWWNKPQGVGVPVFLETNIPVREKREPSGMQGTDQAEGEREGSTRVVNARASVESPQSIGIPVFLATKRLAIEERKRSAQEGRGQAEKEREIFTMAVDAGTSVESPVGKNVGEGRKTRWRTMWEGVKGIWRGLKGTLTAEVPRKEVPLKHRSFFIQQLVEDKKHPQWQLLWRMPYALVLAMLRPLAKLLEFTYTDRNKWDLRVPMFSTDGGEDETIYVVSSIIASLFGLVHFIPAWFLNFPSHPERLLWRISAGIITGQPIILGMWSKWKKGMVGLDYSDSSPLLTIIALTGVPLYIVARLTLIVLALLALRDLSQGALVSIEWISFVPHL